MQECVVDKLACGAGNSGRSRLSAGSGRLKGGCGQDWPPSKAIWIFPALVLSACSQPARSAANLLPASVGGVWQRKSLRDIAPPRPGVVRAFEAGYEGGGKVTVDLYETKVSGTAFEMTQHWRASGDSVFFDKGRYFVLVKWEQADRQALTAFVRGLQKQLEE